MVTTPGASKPKPASRKKPSIQADLDVAKELSRCRDEGVTRLDLSRSNVRAFHLPTKHIPAMPCVALNGERVTAYVIGLREAFRF